MNERGQAAWQTTSTVMRISPVVCMGKTRVNHERNCAMEAFYAVLGCVMMFFGAIGFMTVCSKACRFVGAVIAKNPDGFKKAIDGPADTVSRG